MKSLLFFLCFLALNSIQDIYGSYDVHKKAARTERVPKQITKDIKLPKQITKDIKRQKDDQSDDDLSTADSELADKSFQNIDRFSDLLTDTASEYDDNTSEKSDNLRSESEEKASDNDEGSEVSEDDQSETSEASEASESSEARQGRYNAKYSDNDTVSVESESEAVNFAHINKESMQSLLEKLHIKDLDKHTEIKIHLHGKSHHKGSKGDSYSGYTGDQKETVEDLIKNREEILNKYKRHADEQYEEIEKLAQQELKALELKSRQKLELALLYKRSQLSEPLREEGDFMDYFSQFKGLLEKLNERHRRMSDEVGNFRGKIRFIKEAISQLRQYGSVPKEQLEKMGKYLRDLDSMKDSQLKEIDDAYSTDKAKFYKLLEKMRGYSGKMKNLKTKEEQIAHLQQRLDRKKQLIQDKQNKISEKFDKCGDECSMIESDLKKKVQGEVSIFEELLLPFKDEIQTLGQSREQSKTKFEQSKNQIKEKLKSLTLDGASDSNETKKLLGEMMDLINRMEKANQQDEENDKLREKFYAKVKELQKRHAKELAEVNALREDIDDDQIEKLDRAWNESYDRLKELGREKGSSNSAKFEELKGRFNELKKQIERFERDNLSSSDRDELLKELKSVTFDTSDFDSFEKSLKAGESIIKESINKFKDINLINEMNLTKELRDKYRALKQKKIDGNLTPEELEELKKIKKALDDKHKNDLKEISDLREANSKETQSYFAKQKKTHEKTSKLSNEMKKESTDISKRLQTRFNEIAKEIEATLAKKYTPTIDPIRAPNPPIREEESDSECSGTYCVVVKTRDGKDKKHLRIEKTKKSSKTKTKTKKTAA